MEGVAEFFRCVGLGGVGVVIIVKGVRAERLRLAMIEAGDAADVCEHGHSRVAVEAGGDAALNALELFDLQTHPQSSRCGISPPMPFVDYVRLERQAFGGWQRFAVQVGNDGVDPDDVLFSCAGRISSRSLSVTKMLRL